MEQSPADPQHVMAVVDAVTLVATLSLKVLEDNDTYNTLQEITLRLHNVLLSLPASDSPLKANIVSLCELWWKKDLLEKELFGRTALLFTLRKSFALKKSGVEIQRVWNLHDVLLSLDYSSEENKELIHMLLQCIQRHTYVRNDDGKRFLVFLFSWNMDFICKIHSTIKNQLEFCNKAMTGHITEIYYRAWKKASGEFQEKIETLCIQDLMHNAIFLRRSSPVYSKVRQIVVYFHSKKVYPGVDKMLYTLYKPILWTALTVPNEVVRANATVLFTDAFPIHNPEDNTATIEENIQKQLDSAMTLLDDPQPVVRSSAILGVCKIVAKCWELLPPDIITAFMGKVIELASDSSSSDVRCSVFLSLPIVLNNVFSHPLMETLLQKLKYSLHDNSEKVRVAFLDMLMKMTAVRAAKFWEVCSMDHLLGRLAIDSPSVSKRLTNLLFKSFFPANESDSEWCNRCMTLIQMNPMAARKLYLYAHMYTTPTNILKLMLAIRRMLNVSIMTNSDLSDINDGNKENSVVEPHPLMNDKALVSGLLEVLVILWRSIQKALLRNEEAQTYTFQKFQNVAAKYFQAFEDERATVALIQLASFMPPSAVPTFSCGVLSRLRRMESGASTHQYSQLLECLCSWGQASDVLELITDWLSEPLPKQGEKTNTGRKVRLQATVEAKPDLALAYLEHLFNHQSIRETVLALDQTPLKQLHTILGNWKSVLYDHLSSTSEASNRPSVETALKAFMYHARLGAHLQHNLSKGRDFLLSLENMAVWVADKVLPYLAKGDDDSENSERTQTLATEITESFLTVCCDVLLVGLADETFKGQILHMCSLVLLAETGYQFSPVVLQILKEVASSCVPANSEQDQETPAEVILGVIANIFQKIIELLARRLRKEPEEGKQLCLSAVPDLTDFLQVVQTLDKAPLSGVFSTLFAVIIIENKYLLQKVTHPEELITPETLEDMPPLSSILLSCILKSASTAKSFLAEISSCVESEGINSLLDLTAVLHILAVVKHAGQCKGGLKNAAVCVQQQLHRHAVASGDSGNIQRFVYESSVKTLNEILHL